MAYAAIDSNTVIQVQNRCLRTAFRLIPDKQTARECAAEATASILLEDNPLQYLEKKTKFRVIDALRSIYGRAEPGKPAPKSRIRSAISYGGFGLPNQEDAESLLNARQRHDEQSIDAQRFIESLPGKYREVIEMRYLGLRDKEIGKRLGVSESRICQMRSRIGEFYSNGKPIIKPTQAKRNKMREKRMDSTTLESQWKDFDLNRELDTIHVRFIERALAETGGKISAAARLLKIQRTTLFEQMKKFNIPRHPKNTEPLAA